MPSFGQNLSVYIIAKNEEETIEDCLRSVAGAAEIVVVDAMSVDRTADICRKFGCRVYGKQWVSFAAQKQHALDLCRMEWVLNLDADERLTPEGREEIARAVAEGAHEGYLLPTKNIMFGRWMRGNGMFPDYHLRLFRRASGSYKAEERIHEQVYCRGSVDTLREPIRHLTLRAYSHRLSKTNHYTDIIVRQRCETRRRGVSWQEFVLAPIKMFLLSYFVRKGFRDAMPGLVFSMHAAFGEFIIAVKTWERLRGSGHSISRGAEGGK